MEMAKELMNECCTVDRSSTHFFKDVISNLAIDMKILMDKLK